MNQFQKDVENALRMEGATWEHATVNQLYDAVAKGVLAKIAPKWQESGDAPKTACYFSAEFLVGRLIYNNLLNLGLMDSCRELFERHGLSLSLLEEVEDAALGNGGLGRLAACFLDSAATHRIPLNGYGIRYQYGLFRQSFQNGFQQEEADDWLRFGDPFSLRREEEAVTVSMKGQTVKAVPYDMPVIGYGGKAVNTLRLWQAEPVHPFNFALFNQQKYAQAVKEDNDARMISRVLYPNDDTNEGKKLRLKQQYFFSSASLKDLIRRYKQTEGNDFSRFSKRYAIQLNDTHPVVSIPEFIRILTQEEGVSFEDALSYARETFAYTNHTIMAEALEKWRIPLFKFVLPELYKIILQIDEALTRELESKNIRGKRQVPYHILQDDQIHMARLAIFATHSTNGVAKIHTNILKKSALRPWYRLYPQRFNNKTNGITQRRWLLLCNPELSAFITKHIGKSWITDLTRLKRLEPFIDDPAALEEFARIKTLKKQQLCEYIRQREGVSLDPAFLFDIQAKRLHEYKRQLLNAFSILDIYFGLKDGRIREFTPTVFLFGAKAAPGYFRAKAVIKYINEIAKKINADPAVNDKLKVLFVQNYDVSYAEKLMPAADVSEQISTAGTEASGTGNMKFMLNGAVTLGTMDGANIEIVEQAGEENNYIFGATVEDIRKIQKEYDPNILYQKEPRIKAVVDTLIDGTFDDEGTGMFQELYDAILKGASWHKPDHYYLLLDFLPYCDAKLRANADYRNRLSFTKKCFANTVHAGRFSSDRTIQEYAKKIWGL